MGDMHLLLDLDDEAIRWVNSDWIGHNTMPPCGGTAFS